MLALGLCLLGLIGSAPSAASQVDVRSALVAIGDIHGAHDELVGLLRSVGLVDELGNWSGGQSTLVQTGDMLDRGADARRVMDLMIRLQGEAKEAGGRVVVLLGNHEIMNLVGARQDVAPGLLERFIDRESEARQRDAFRQYEERVLRDNRDYRRANRAMKRRVQREWMEDHPRGLVEMVRALGPDGSYGRWLRSLPVYWKQDGYLFMHAGISEAHAEMSLEKIDARIHAELRALDRYRRHLVETEALVEVAGLSEMAGAAGRSIEGLASVRFEPDEPSALPALPATDASLEKLASWEALAALDRWYLFAPEGPMWFRGYARWDYEEVRELAPSILSRVGVATIVVGHTPQPEGIRVRAEGAVYLIDTGMQRSVYDGRPEALVLEDGRARAIRPSGESRLLPAPAAMSLSEASR